MCLVNLRSTLREKMVLMCPQHVSGELTWIRLSFCSSPQVEDTVMSLTLTGWAAHAGGFVGSSRGQQQHLQSP